MAKEYLISEETKGKKRTVITAIKNDTTTGITVRKIVETLDDKGVVKSTKKDEVYRPEKRIITRTTGKNNPDEYRISGGEIIWHGQH